MYKREGCEGYVKGAREALDPHGYWLVKGVKGLNARPCARASRTHIPKNHKAQTFTYTAFHPSRPSRPSQASSRAGLRREGWICTPFTPFTEFEMADTRMVCTAENTAEFNARLRTELAPLFDLAKELHKLGMIDGLRGARIRATSDPKWRDEGTGVPLSQIVTGRAYAPTKGPR